MSACRLCLAPAASWCRCVSSRASPRRAARAQLGLMGVSQSLRVVELQRPHAALLAKILARLSFVHFASRAQQHLDFNLLIHGASS